LGSEVDGLLGRSALTIDRRSGDLNRETGRKQAVAGDVYPLLADLTDAAGDDVVHAQRVDAGPLYYRFEDVSEEIDGVYPRELSALLAAAERCPDGLDDDGFTHDYAFRWVDVTALL
jgi:hypothetical protein